MKKFNYKLFMAIAFCVSILMQCNTSKSSEEHSSYDSEVEAKIDSLLNLMTIREKIGQLNLLPYGRKDPEFYNERLKNGEVGGFLKAHGAAHNKAIQKFAVEESRLGIPLMFQEDVIHGYKTIAPVPLAESCSWDIPAIEKSAAIAAKEAAASGIHLTYAPMVDISRDPRWGRILEAAGEDPYLGSLVAAARVRGFQGNDLSSTETLLACVKHFAGYGASLAGRDYNIIDFSERDLREIYLPPFKAAIDAGSASLMSAYTTVNSVPATANSYLMNDILRDELGFEGMVITDWETIQNITEIGLTKNDNQSAELAIDCNIDIDMTSEVYLNELEKLIENKKVSEGQLNKAVRRVLRAKFSVGLFDDPYAYFDEERERETHLSKEHWDATREMAMKSMVLLKNEKNTLPLNKSINSVAIIGPLAKRKKDLNGWWWAKGDPEDVISLYEGIEAALPNTKIYYEEGCKIDSFRLAGKELIPQAVQTAKKADVVIMALGEEFWMSGEGAGSGSLHIPSVQEELLAEVRKTGKPIITVMLTGRPYILTEIAENSDALLQAWFPGSTAGEAIANILLGDYNPSGKLATTFPYHEGQVPIYYGYKRTSHSWTGSTRYVTKHIDLPHTPLYPFGYGLSYTDYKYDSIKLSDSTMSIEGTIEASIIVKNIGKVAGEEIVQLYIQDLVCSVVRPEKELKGFEKIYLKPGQSKKVNFVIDKSHLTFLNQDLKETVEAGEFNLYIGKNSMDTNSIKFELK